MAKADKMWYMNGTFKTKEEFIAYLLTLRALGFTNQEIGEKIHYSTGRIYQLIGSDPDELKIKAARLRAQNRKMRSVFHHVKGKDIIDPKVAREEEEAAMNRFYETTRRLSEALIKFCKKGTITNMKAIRKEAQSLAGDIAIIANYRSYANKAS